MSVLCATIDQDLETALAEAGSAWPRLKIPEGFFRNYVQERLATTELSSAVHPRLSDLYLACGCALADPAAIAEFEKRYLPKVGAFISQVSRDTAFVAEVQQLLREKLLLGRPKIADYTGRGTLDAWLRIAAVRTALNLRRKQAQPNTVPLERAFCTAGFDPELQCIQAQHRAEFRAALESIAAALNSDERGILKLHYVDGLTIDQISTLYSRPRSTVARKIKSARSRLLWETRCLLAQRLSLSPADLDSMLRGVQSQIHISLPRLLG